MRETNHNTELSGRVLGGLMLAIVLVIFGFVLVRFLNSMGRNNKVSPQSVVVSGTEGGKTAAVKTPQAVEMSSVPEKKAKYSFYEQLQRRSREVEKEIARKTAAQANRPAVKGKNYRIQIGAFHDREQAESLRAAMILRNFPTEIISDRDFYLVQIGPYVDKSEAESMRKKLIHDFDPPHNGHNTIVKMAINIKEIEKLIIMPTYINPFKNEFCASPQLRLKWVKKCWGDLNKVIISDFEIRQNRPVPTIQSIDEMYKIYNPDTVYLIIGADHLANLHKWHEFKRLSTLVKFIIASRDHIVIPNELDKMDINVDISSSQIRANPDNSEVIQIIKTDVLKFYKG